MENLTPSSQIVANQTNTPQEVMTKDTSNTSQKENTSNVTIHHTKNLYPVVRHILLVICVLFSITLILLLMHQNGKSIYDNGI